MPLPISKLFNKNYSEITNDMVESIAKYSEEWTNYNPSDPGITILELLSWISENTLYRMDQVPKKLYFNFVRLAAGVSGKDIDSILSEKGLDQDYRRFLNFLKDIEDQHLFSIGAEHQEQLNQRSIPKKFIKLFLEKKNLLSPHATIEIKEVNKHWTIEDLNRIYVLEKNEEMIHIHKKGRNVNVLELKSAILKFFEKEYRAISGEDFARHAVEATKGEENRVERAITKIFPEEGRVEVIIISSQEDALAWGSKTKADLDVIYQGLIPIVKGYLEERKLIGTLLDVSPPQYTTLKHLKIEIVCPFHVFREELQKRIEDKLRWYFHPILGGPEHKGWPYGRTLTIYEIAQVVKEIEEVEGIKQITIDGGAIEKPTSGLIYIENKESIEVIVQYEEHK